MPQQLEDVTVVGGRLVLSRCCNLEVIATTRRLGHRSYPGVMKATEAFSFWRAGDDVKLVSEQVEKLLTAIDELHP